MENTNTENSKKITLPIKIIIIGCALGLVVAGIGGVKQLNAKKTNEARAAEALKESQAAVDEANARLSEIETEYNTLESQYDEKTKECNEINEDMTADDWFTKSSQCSNEKVKIKSEMNELETEQWTLKNKDYTVYYSLVKPMSYYIFYIIGGSIAGLALLGAFIIYLVKGKKGY